ncbi:Alpha/Beta hydrolase protein [Mycena pura]|uniref:Alpha/Beta hydrolase protein n=1 Tax=Mycena pura TaxID=153505 RepID=A0AAD6VN37_9AGAR|nr:Alpha/Beta hydrolase protein [Mycena pura]
MTGISFPVEVVILLRRLVNVISSLSVSNQYLLRKQANAELREKPLIRDDGRNQKWTSISSLRISGWRWMSENALAPTSGYPSIHASTSSLPWWSWPTFNMTSSQTQTESESDPSPSPPEYSLPSRRANSSSSLSPLKSPESPTPPPEPRRPSPEEDPSKLDTIHQLLLHPALFDPLRTPRYPIVLCHGLYGFDSRGPSSFPSMRMHYWSNVLGILRDKVAAEVIITSVPGTGSIVSRSEALDQQLKSKARGRGVNFLAHSMGGLDCRHLISHIKPNEYVPLSLTSISTPHRGSPFMDWCTENIGIGKLKREEFLSRSAAVEEYVSSTASPDPSSATADGSSSKAKDGSFSLSQLPSSFATLLLGIVDSPAYANLTTNYLNNVFNPQTPDDPRVKYFSVAGRMPGVNIWHPFWLPKMVLDGVEAKERERLRKMWERADKTEPDPLWQREREWGNDGLVTVQSAKWGEFLGIMEGSDHWEMRGARGIEFGVDLPALPAIGLGGPGNPGSSSSSQGDGWGLMDWGRFVRAWKKEEKIQLDAASAASGRPQPSTAREEEQIKQKTDDAIIKNSTEKLSSAFDWLLEQVPVPPLLGSKSKAIEDTKNLTEAEVRQMHGKGDTEKPIKKAELASKSDLERFYIALSRKIYEEGL